MRRYESSLIKAVWSQMGVWRRTFLFWVLMPIRIIHPFPIQIGPISPTSGPLIFQ